MKFLPCIFIFFLFTGQQMLAQNQTIEGSILHAISRQPIAYATVYNRTLKQGAISNAEGYFRIPISTEEDSVRISFVGFKDQYLKLDSATTFYKVLLETSTQELGAVTITPEDDSYLYDLLNWSRKSQVNTTKQAKAYYHLESLVDQKQTELVEGYYNVDLRGYALEKMHLKAGRLGLQPFEKRYFASLESSRALAMFNLFEKNGYFPLNPLAMSKGQMKKHFRLHLENQYVDALKDTICVIAYQPKAKNASAFEGKVWVKKAEHSLVKITLQCDSAARHPFLPLFPTDKISGVAFRIALTFESKESDMYFQHIDFDYEIAYRSRIGEPNAQGYRVNTSAVLHAYAYDEAFTLPHFSWDENSTGDYRKINAMPYNEFFWNHHTEYRMQEQTYSSDHYFADANTITNQRLFQAYDSTHRGVFEHPYVHWSENRIRFREMKPDTAAPSVSPQFKSDQYQLAAKIFVDVNTYADSTHVLTATIFDPYESYYHLPMDQQTHCFINMYFDLCEMERRKLHAQIEAGSISPARDADRLERFISGHEASMQTYLKAVQRGTNEVEMRKYNSLIVKQLGIDNMALFGIFQGEE